MNDNYGDLGFVPDNNNSDLGFIPDTVQPSYLSSLLSSDNNMSVGQNAYNNLVGAPLLGLTHMGGNIIGDRSERAKSV